MTDTAEIDPAGTLEPGTRADRGRFIRSSDRRIWIITAIAAVAIMAFGLAVAVGIKENADHSAGSEADKAQRTQQTTDIGCVREWAIAFANRADRITGLSEARNDALDTVLLAAIAREPAAKVKALADTYKAIVLARRRVLKDNPLPPSPEFSCGVTAGPTAGPSHGPSSSSPRPTPSATPSATRRPSTPQAARPGAQVTVPGRTVTRTATRVTTTTAAVTTSPLLPRCVSLPPVPVALPTGIRLC